MPTNSNSVLYRTPLVDPATGLITRDWTRFFDALQQGMFGTWTQWSPALTPSTGTLTGVSFDYASYVTFGPLVYAAMLMRVTPSVACQIRFTLPVNLSRAQDGMTCNCADFANGTYKYSQIETATNGVIGSGPALVPAGSQVLFVSVVYRID